MNNSPFNRDEVIVPIFLEIRKGKENPIYFLVSLTLLFRMFLWFSFPGESNTITVNERGDLCITRKPGPESSVVK